MSNLSWPLSHLFHTDTQHAGFRFQKRQNQVHHLAPKLNKSRKTTLGKTGSTGQPIKIQSTEFCIGLGRERRWSKWLLLSLRKNMLLTIEEVAKEHLKVSRATVYRLIRRGELRASKVLGCTRIDPKELARYEQMIGGVR